MPFPLRRKWSFRSTGPPERSAQLQFCGKTSTSATGKNWQNFVNGTIPGPAIPGLFTRGNLYSRGFLYQPFWIFLQKGMAV